MNERIASPEGFAELAKNYRRNLSEFREQSKLPKSMFDEPDHAMVKAVNLTDFEEKVKKIKSWSPTKKIAFMELDRRFLAIAEFAAPFPVTESKQINYIEIFESKYTGYKGMEYVSFFVPNLNEAQEHLEKRNIGFRRDWEHNLNWRWLAVPINDEGQEVRFSDTKLIKVLEQELDNGSARII